MSQSENNPFPYRTFQKEIFPKNTFQNPSIDMGNGEQHKALQNRLTQLGIAKSYINRNDNGKVDNINGMTNESKMHELHRPTFSK